MDATRSALACIESINEAKRESNTYVDSFIERVKAEKDKLEKSFYEELLKSSDDMKAYTDETTTKLSIVYNMTQLKETFEKNEEVLVELKTRGIPDFYVGSINSWKNGLTTIKAIFLEYSHDGLAIDYSSFKLEKESNQVLSTFKSLIQSGIAGLVLEDMDGLSIEKLPEDALISKTKNIKKEDTSETLDDLLLSVTEEKKDNDMVGSLKQAGIDFGGVLANGANTLLENLLYIVYLEEHCSDYILQGAKNEQILNYELEYILFGNTVDKENIEAIATRIVLLRAIVNLLHVFTDSQKTNTALTFATALVGFSGLPFLVSITKYIVLVIWAFEAALIETAAIMMGKEVPILTTRENFTLEFSEILSMSRENIITKAKNYQSANEGLRFGYREYLRLFLFLQDKSKQNYRTMDLIQENIKYVYDSDFLLSRCYVNYEVSARFEMPQVFLSMPFIGNNERKAVKGYEYKVNAAVSY